MTTKRTASPRLGVHGCSHGGGFGSRRLTCPGCGFVTTGQVSKPCRHCGETLVTGGPSTAATMRRSKPPSCGKFGERSPLEEAATNALLAAAREEASK